MDQQDLEDPRRSGAAIVARNGVVAWVRIVGVLIAKLMTTRLLLEAMGVEAFGVYFAAISVALLSGLLTSAMQITSLRAISLQVNGEDEMAELFSSLLGLHLLIALLIFSIGSTIGAWFINSTLGIPSHLVNAANFSFFCILLAMTIGALLAPYEAFLQSRESFAVFSYLEILREWLLVPTSYGLSFLKSGQLEVFAAITTGTSLATMLIGAWIAMRSYAVTRPRIKFFFNRKTFRSHGSLFSWNIAGSLSAAARNQGLPIIINVVGGPAANAAYVVGNQIAAALRNFATSLPNVLAPRIYSRTGQGDLDGMLGLAFTACKVSMLVAVAFSVPLIFEMPTVLRAWLGRADPIIVFVASLMLVNQLIDQTSAATGIAHMAIGRLARFYIVAGGISLLMLPAAYLVGRATGDFRDVLFVALGFTVVIAILRVSLLEAHLPGATRRWLSENVVPVLVASLAPISLALCIVIVSAPTFARLVINSAACGILILVSSYAIALTPVEQEKFREVLRLNNGGV
jgi:O-antigen/teichoic acid export membrane protein